MKKIFKYSMMLAAAMVMSAGMMSCSSSDDNGGSTEDKFKDRTYGQQAVSSCQSLQTELEQANEVIGKANLTQAQEEYLYGVLENVVDNVIVPTYTNLANETEALEKDLKGLSVSTITQQNINDACQAFLNARLYWERSEAFLGGAASDFDVDPTIDSWPLNRSLLHNYFRNGMSEEMLDDATILGFHALEFILFRNGQPRKVEELKANDTYTGFSDVTGKQELEYAQQVCKLLKERTFQLQVAWEGQTAKNASRAAVVEAAGLGMTTEGGLSYGDNMKLAGKNAKSLFPTLKSALSQLLSDDEGSAFAIVNEVGAAKIANPFSKGDLSYVESPYSYNSITDFADNIRSVQNVWNGTTSGQPNSSVKSFYNFFQSVDSPRNASVTAGITNAINRISAMPSPFVKYCSAVWNKEF